MEHDFESTLEEVIKKTIEAIMTSCLLSAEVLNALPDCPEEVYPSELASKVIAGTLINLCHIGDKDSVLLTLRKEPDGWASHIHFDYLDADPEHLAEDFHWATGNDTPEE